MLSKLARAAQRWLILRDVERRRHKARAFLCYISHPFLSVSRMGHHPNIREARTITRVLDQAGFTVDVADYRISPHRVSSDYDLYFGFGDALERVATSMGPHQRLISYATGCAAPYQAAETMRRGLAYQSQYGTFPADSLRIPPGLWPSQISLAHAVLLIGDESTARTFHYYPGRNGQIRRQVPATHWTTSDGASIIASRDWNHAKSNVVWFGGPGIVHKGLDLCIAAAAQLGIITLHVCGVRREEIPVVERCMTFHGISNERVRLHGFVHPNSGEFKALATDCAFVVLPSCSEAHATSVLTAVAAGGLVPIISERCGFDHMPTPFRLNELATQEVVRVMKSALEFGGSALHETAHRCFEYVATAHSIEKYESVVRDVVDQVVTPNTADRRQ